MIILPPSAWEIRDSSHKGRGVFAKKRIAEGTVIAKYTGRKVRYEEIDYEKYEDYLMYHDDEYGIIPHLSKVGAHLINHSCNPNCFLYPFEGATFFFSIRDINPEEEITINYMYPPKREQCKVICKHICYCGEENCRGTMHLSDDEFEWWQSIIRRS